MADINFYPAINRTGGTDDDLDGYDGANLNDGDAGYVVSATTGVDVYTLDATSGATANGDTIIAPATNPGTKRWIKKEINLAGDADTLDSVHASSFLRSDQNDEIVGALTITNNSTNALRLNKTADTQYSGIQFEVNSLANFLFYTKNNATGDFAIQTRNYDTDGSYKATVLNIDWDTAKVDFNVNPTFNGNALLSTADEGSGNGLDADTLDGVEGANFLRSNVDDTLNSDKSFNIGTGEGSVRLRHDSAGNRFYIAPYDGGAYDWTKEITFDADVGEWNIEGDPLAGGNRILTTADEGTGNGLDADTLDGQHSSYFSTTAHNHTLTAPVDAADSPVGVFPSGISSCSVNSGSSNYPTSLGTLYTNYHSTYRCYQMFASNTDADKWYYRHWYNGTWSSWFKIWNEGNDGSGSGLDADKLDGYEATAFQRPALTETGGGAVQATGDWNDYKTTGFYRGTGMSNMTPFRTHAWQYTQVIQHSGNYCVQLALGYEPDAILSYRILENTVWGSWHEVYGDTNSDHFLRSDVDDVFNGQLEGKATLYWDDMTYPSFSPEGGADSVTDVCISIPVNKEIAFHNTAGNIRNLIKASNTTIHVGQSGTGLISAINLLPGTSGVAQVNGDRILTVADEGSGNNLDADTLDGMHASAIMAAPSPTVIEWDDSNTLEYSRSMSPASYFTSGEYWEVFSITPGGNSRNYLVKGTIVSNAGSGHVDDFELFVRSDTLPDTTVTLRYNRSEHNDSIGTIPVFWRDTSTGVIKFAIKHVTGSVHNLDAHFKIYCRGDYSADVDVNDQNQVELSSIPGGYAETVATEGLLVDKNEVLYINGVRVLTEDDYGSGSGMDADTVDGLEASAFLLASAYTAADVLSKLLTVDGAGSLLDADKLDGIESSSFVRSNADDTITGDIIFNSELQFESGHHRITYNDGGGNFNFRVGNYFNGANHVYSADGKGAIHLEFAHESSNPTFNIKIGEDPTGKLAGDTVSFPWHFTLKKDGTITWGGNKVFHAGNDGSGSGLDADKLDGNEASAFQLLSAKDAANGYPGLSASSLIAPAQMGSGTRDGTKFLRDDGTWQSVSSTDADTVDTYHASTARGTSTVVVRNSSGDIYVDDVYAYRGDGTGAVFLGDGSHYLYYNGTAYYLNAADLYVNSVRMPKPTYSTGAPSGGSDGDVHYQYV